MLHAARCNLLLHDDVVRNIYEHVILKPRYFFYRKIICDLTRIFRLKKRMCGWTKELLLHTCITTSLPKWQKSMNFAKSLYGIFRFLLYA